ncbi:MAG: hypothetical protein JSS83_11095 [Cyanobacteria bacterium SZAS LIN-3]|nr:hypothetical protein [Cyanobacteria bacterium SZAS LIN-3]MBS2005990.1 hypothetical protein [Cyanobacteria bacterium SZAS TMP-1]
MNPHAFELLLNSVALTSLVAVLAPKLVFHLSLRRLNKSTIGHLGATAYKPKSMVCRKTLDAAAASVKKALAKKTRDFSWIIREHKAESAASQTVQIEAFLPAAKIAELRQADKIERGNGVTEVTDAALDIKIRVDIYERPEGTEIVWKYLPNSAADVAKRQSLLDPRHNSLLWQTNSELLSELEPQLVKA